MSEKVIQTRMSSRMRVSIKLFGIAEPKTAWKVRDVLELGTVLFEFGVDEKEE